jgi:coenzyme Q-binding protein COQ10
MAKVTQTELFNCSVEDFFKVVVDYEKYPEFMDEVQSVRVLKSEGGVQHIEYKISVIKTITYVLEMSANPPTETRWKLVKGDLFKKLDGSWRLQDEGGKCRAEYSVDIEFGIFVPGPIVKTLQTVNLRSMMSAFHKRVEELHG